MFPHEFIGIPRIRQEFSRFFYKYCSSHSFLSHNKAKKQFSFDYFCFRMDQPCIDPNTIMEKYA